MKEAAGEANMTVITIVLIGVVAAAGAILLPNVMDGVKRRAACSEMGGQLTSRLVCQFRTVNDNGTTTTKTCNLQKTGSEWICQ